MNTAKGITDGVWPFRENSVPPLSQSPSADEPHVSVTLTAFCFFALWLSHKCKCALGIFQLYS